MTIPCITPGLYFVSTFVPTRYINTPTLYLSLYHKVEVRLTTKLNITLQRWYGPDTDTCYRVGTSDHRNVTLFYCPGEQVP